MATTSVQNPLAIEASHYAELYALSVFGKASHDGPSRWDEWRLYTLVYLALLKKHPRAARKDLQQSARYAASLAASEYTNGPSPAEAAVSTADEKTHAILQDAKPGIEGLKALGGLATRLTDVVSGKHHVLLRAAYVFFGGVFLIWGLRILAGEIGAPNIAKAVKSVPGSSRLPGVK